MKASEILTGLPPSLKDVLRAPFRIARLEGPVHASLRVLREEGWLRSYQEKRPVTRDGGPLPWYTYSAIEFLAERLPADANVFEFGAGYSTLWYAQRVARVVSVEPSAVWVERLTASAPPNAEVLCRPDKEGYLEEIARHGIRWDVVAIDSVHRPSTTRVTIDNLTPRGVVVWDNSRLPEFSEHMRDFFAPAGFRELPFGGLVPIVPSFDRTSILYRAENCLGI
jgi:hypothetical protein